MIVSIAQPAYLPWPGYFDRIARSDLHIVLDSVPIQRGNRDRFTNRNRIRTPAGSQWLTVPVRKPGGEQPLITEVMVDDSQRWQARHWGALIANYGQAASWGEHADWFEAFYRRPWVRLVDALECSTAYLLEVLGVGTRCIASSGLTAAGAKSDYILALCQEVAADVYLSGPLGRGYLDASAFERAGISIEYHDYAAPTYVQAFPGFVANLSAVDLIANHGARSRSILWGGPA
jgi:hypothetical protein